MSYQQGGSEEQGGSQHPVAGPSRSHTSAPAPGPSTSASAHHNKWEPIYVRTSKCDFCSKRNPGVLQKCAACIIVICQDCVGNGRLQRDPKHAVRDPAAAFNWTVPSKKSRAGPAFPRARSASLTSSSPAPLPAAPRTPARRASQDTILVEDDSESEASPLAGKGKDKGKGKGKKRAHEEGSNNAPREPKKARTSSPADEPRRAAQPQPQHSPAAPSRGNTPGSPPGNPQGHPQEPVYGPPRQDLWRANQLAHNLAEHFRRETHVLEQVLSIWMTHPGMLQERQARGDMAALQSLQEEAARMGQENHLRPNHIAMSFLDSLRAGIAQQGPD